MIARWIRFFTSANGSTARESGSRPEEEESRSWSSILASLAAPPEDPPASLVVLVATLGARLVGDVHPRQRVEGASRVAATMQQGDRLSLVHRSRDVPIGRYEHVGRATH